MNPPSEGVAAGVVERERMERALHESEARLRSVVNSAPMILWALDREGVFTFSEGKGLRVLGIEAGEMVGRSVFEVYADVPQILEDTRRALRGEEFISMVEVGDSTFEVRYSTVRDGKGRIDGAIGVAIDVTERKRTEADLARSLSLLRATLESTADGILVVDSAGRIISFNRKFAKMWRIPASILESQDDGRAIAHVLDQLEHPEVFVEKVKDLYAEPASHSCDLLTFRDGRIFERYSQPQRVGDQIVGRVWSFRDVTERKRAEAALRISETRFRTMFEQFPLSIQIFTPGGETVEVNQAWRDLFRMSPEDLGDFNPLHDPQLEGLASFIRRGFEGEATAIPASLFDVRRAGRPQEGEEDGPDARWIQAFACPVKDDEGTVREVFIIHQDITQQKEAEAALQRAHHELEERVEERTAELEQTNEALEEEIAERERAEEELRRSEEHFRSLIENGADLIIVVDPDGITRYAGPSAPRVIGWSPEERVGHSSTELIHPDDLPEVGRLRDEAIASPGTPVPLEFRYRHKNGSWMVLEGIVKTLKPDTAAAGLVVNVRDVTARKRAELALRKSEALFRSTVENVSDLITILDANGIVKFESAVIQRLFGYTPEELIGRHALELVHPDDLEATQRALLRVLQNPGTPHSAEFRFRHKDGSWRFVESVGCTLSAGSAEEGVVVSSRDISERKRFEEELRAAKEEAEAAREAAENANRAKSEFLSRMSHELRTPMNSILGFAQLLAKKDPPPDQRKGLDHILKAGRHLLNLINEVLDIARIEANRQHLSLEPVRVAGVLQEALNLIRPLAAQRGCRLYDATIDGDPYVHADRQRLTQVLLNLLSNAVKYNRPEGSVRVSCEVTGERLRIRVHDTGYGIPAEQRGELFVPFARLGAERSSVEGTGLGLALSKRLVEAMHGSLDVESRPGEGSTFWVDLPLADSPLERLARAGPVEPAASPGPATRPATLLYIEDNLANYSLVETILAARPQTTVLSALQGQMGLDLAWEHDPDLVLLDLHLPDVRGDEVLRRLRGDHRTRGTPVIVISADATPGRIRELLASGADAYLTKPLDVDQFVETIDRVLAARGD